MKRIQRTKPKSSSFSLRERIRYHLDNAISRGPHWFMLALTVFGLIVSVVVTLARWGVHSYIPSWGNQAVLTNLWSTVNTVLFDTKLSGDNTPERLLYLISWIADIAISAIIIGFITSKIMSRIEQLRGGKAPVVESGHVLILGWSPRVFPLIEQLAIARTDLRRPAIVVVADIPVPEMVDLVAERCTNLGKTRVICRRGDITNPDTLRNANLEAASAIIVLDESNESDVKVIATVLAVKVVDTGLQVPMVVEIDDEYHASALRHAISSDIRTVRSDSLISQVTAQASRQPGLASVWAELLDFDGDEFYIQSEPQVVGCAYKEVVTAFEHASVLGIMRGSEVLVNPNQSEAILPGDELIFLAKDRKSISFTGLRNELASVSSTSDIKGSSEPERILFVGWSEMGDAVLHNLASFMPAGSAVTVLADERYFSRRPDATYGLVTTTFRAISGANDVIEEIAHDAMFNEIVILAYRKGMTSNDADAMTMLNMLLINQHVATGDIQRTRLVAELLDARHFKLARVTNPDDLVVSENLTALMMAQLSQDGRLEGVFDDLFDAEGNTLHVKPVELFVEIGSSPSYAHIVAAGVSRGESVLGYRVAATREVVMNPANSTEILAAEGDGVVVIAR